MEHKVCELSNVEIKAGPSGFGRIAGYGATFNNKDRQGDIIMPGAFKDGLDVFKRDGFIAVGHDHAALPVAMVDVVREDSKGLWLEADFHSTPEAQAARTVAQERLAAGKSVSFSIGYAVPDGGAEHTKDARLLKKVDTYEVSLVNIPANPQALVAGVKEATVSEASFDDRVEALVSDAHEIIELAKHMHEVRVKENRALATAKREALRAVLDMLTELYAATEPRPKQEQPAQEEAPKGIPSIVAAQKLQDMRLKLAQHGVYVN